jgi:hypothetical protein
MYGQRDQYENMLRHLGCQQIGSGLYSNVFAFPGSDKVIKVANYDRWPEYILWSTKNGHAGKYAPKVFSLKFKEDFYVAVMERLVCTIGEMKCPNTGYRMKCEQTKAYHLATGFGYLTCQDEDRPDDFIAYLQTLRDNKLAGDCHEGNVMLRHDGQPVVTDPCSGVFSSSKYRIKNGELTSPV